ncbi:MAG: hypothetical protein ACPIOQ_33000 [Promethearchaeia archaeon]
MAPEVDPACPLSELNRVFDGQVGVSFNGQQFTTQDVDLYYYGVFGLFPSHGPLSGGTVVSITGPNLQHGFNDQLEMACLLMGELVVSVSARYACPRASAQSQTQFLVCVCVDDIPPAHMQPRLFVPMESRYARFTTRRLRS